MSVLPVCDEFRESAYFGGNQEKIGKRLAQRLGNDQFGWRNAGTNGSKPGSERAPYQLGSDDREILQQPLHDHCSLNKDMVSGDLAFDLIPISGRLAMKILIAVAVAQRHHSLHPKMVGE